MALTRGGKVLYSLLFLLLVPLALVGWASAASRVVPLHFAPMPRVGAVITLAGLTLLMCGMRDLWVHGGGLPMNAAPPPRYVTRGAYALVPHPIYTGFCVMCAGVSIASGSASGLWLVTPLAMLGCAALVMGYERHDLSERFGEGVRPILPPADASKPMSKARARGLLLGAVPWLAATGAVHLLGLSGALPSPPAASLGVLLAEVLRASALAAFLLAPFLLSRNRDLRSYTFRSLLTLLFAGLLFFVLPLAAPTLPASELVLSASAAWALLIAASVPRGRHATRAATCLWAGVVCAVRAVSLPGGWLPCVTAATAVALALLWPRIWRGLQFASEDIANSWREWQLGPIRVINHGLYVGLGGFVSLTLAGILAGRGHEAAVLIAAVLAVVGALLWAQFVEGSPQMLRPFGFYGGLLGGVVGALIAPLFGTSVWLLLAVFATIGSFGQGIGRMRCLVQGCCHGRPAPEGLGIRYTHPTSRVCRFTGWTNMPLHPTPLYSLLWSGLIAVVVLRLWTLHAALNLITGMYFILNGVGRFVEESYRGEPQTRLVAGLRLYQWAAIGSLIAGACMTAAPGQLQLAPTPILAWHVLPPAMCFGVFTTFAMGVDFPQSNRRFARLT